MKNIHDVPKIIIGIMCNTLDQSKAPKSLDLLTWKVPNFGDALSEWILRRRFPNLELGATLCVSRNSGSSRLLGLGTILHLAKPGDVVWGSGLGNHLKMRMDYQVPAGVTVLSVRGPLSRREFLMHGGSNCPEIYGDPAILLSNLYVPNLVERRIRILPHVHDNYLRKAFSNYEIIEAGTNDALSVVDKIASSSLIITSSLHGVIVAETYNIPVVLYFSGGILHSEPDFKYRDYFASTGRDLFAMYCGGMQEVIRYQKRIPTPDFPDQDSLVMAMRRYLGE